MTKTTAALKDQTWFTPVEKLRGNPMRLNNGQLADHPKFRSLWNPHGCDEAAKCEIKSTITPGGSAEDRSDPPGGRKMPAL